MTNFSVVTSIYPPTDAVRRLAGLDGYSLVVVGDEKSAAGWSCPGATFLPAAEQANLPYNVAALLPWNHYCRKMLGYLYAMARGADVIFDTDDDNMPKDSWVAYPFVGDYATSRGDQGFVNVYKYFTDMHIWPRGFDLRLINAPTAIIETDGLGRENIRVGVWQGLADGDPDVDAIYRLTNNAPCFFEDREPVVLARGTVCPFNSQNTLFRRELFPLLYLPCTVTFRFTDILRGLVAQPIMWLYDYHLGFTKATVLQERNPHDYLKDFESEIPCYLHTRRVMELVGGAIRSNDTLADNLYQAYAALQAHGLVGKDELDILAAWLKDVA